MHNSNKQLWPAFQEQIDFGQFSSAIIIEVVETTPCVLRQLHYSFKSW